MSWYDQRLSEGAKAYLSRITQKQALEAICSLCFKKCGCSLVSTQWKQIDETKYRFKQLVKCDNCKGKTQYEWEHDFAVSPAPVRPKTVV